MEERFENSYCFVILHYKTIADTMKCIQSICNLKCARNEKRSIIVIDNGSNDGSGEKLESTYGEYDEIQVVVLKDNLGFSKGNNFGYSLAKQQNPRYVIVCNSDIVFTQNNTLQVIADVYEETRFDILGPDIYIPAIQFHANPLQETVPSKMEIEQRILHLRKQMKHIWLMCLRDYLFKTKISMILIVRNLFHIHKDAEKAKENIVLQGACYILSEKYMRGNDKLFFPMDSFYCEEYFLYRKCIMNELKMVYEPALRVIHNESSATKSTMKSCIERARFKIDNTIKSLLLYLETEGIQW